MGIPPWIVSGKPALPGGGGSEGLWWSEEAHSEAWEQMKGLQIPVGNIPESLCLISCFQVHLTTDPFNCRITINVLQTPMGLRPFLEAPRQDAAHVSQLWRCRASWRLRQLHTSEHSHSPGCPPRASSHRPQGEQSPANTLTLDFQLSELPDNIFLLF